MEVVPIVGISTGESEGESLSSFLSGELERLERELKELHEDNKKQHEKIGEYKEKYEQLSHQHSIKVHLLEKHKADLKNLNIQLSEKTEEITRLSKRVGEFEKLEEEWKERVENLKKRSFDKDMDNARLHNELRQCRESRTTGEKSLEQVNQHLENFIGGLMTDKFQDAATSDFPSNANVENGEKAGEIKKKLTLAWELTWGKLRTFQEQMTQKDKDFMEAMEELGGCLENIKLTYGATGNVNRESGRQQGEEDVTSEEDSASEGRATPEEARDVTKNNVTNVTIFSDGKNENAKVESWAMNSDLSLGNITATPARRRNPDRSLNTTALSEDRVLDHQGNWCYQCKFCNGLFFNHSILKLHILQKHPTESKNLCSESFCNEENVTAPTALPLTLQPENPSSSGIIWNLVDKEYGPSNRMTEPHLCNQCYNHTFCSSRDVEMHKNLIHADPSNPITCASAKSSPHLKKDHGCKRDSTYHQCPAHSPKKRKKAAQNYDHATCSRQRRWSESELLTPCTRQTRGNKTCRNLKRHQIFPSHSVESILDNFRPSSRINDVGTSSDRKGLRRQPYPSCPHSSFMQGQGNSAFSTKSATAKQKNLLLKMVNVRVVLSPVRSEGPSGDENMGQVPEKSSSVTTSADEDDIVLNVHGI